MEELHPQLVKQARKSGQLNLSNRGLTMVPDKVWNISEFDKEEQKTLSNVTMDSASNENWWDQVDMTKLILACNKISFISPKVIHSKLYQENKLKFVITMASTIFIIPDKSKSSRVIRSTIKNGKFEAIPLY